MEFLKVFLFVLLVILGFFLVSLLLAIPTMLLWNWLVSSIFALREINLLEAWGLNLLTSIFFGATTAVSRK